MGKWVVTCEHGGNEIPSAFQPLFKADENVLQTHRAIDLGAKTIFETLKEKADFSAINTISRLLIELNRSLHHPKLFSEFSKNLNRNEKKRLIEEFYLPYRDRVENEIKSFITQGHNVIHISVHTFTPVLDGQERNTDIGLLYDPARIPEKEFCKQWKLNIQRSLPSIRVRFNYPYLGKADGFVTFLRKKFPANYIGIELEVNQKYEHQAEKIAMRLLETLR